MKYTLAAALFASFAVAGCTTDPTPDRLFTEALNYRLLSNDSATATLERWCGELKMAPEAKIVARRGDRERQPGAEVLRALQVSAGETVRYRQVRLLCGERLMSTADNWYVPSRLTPEMNQALETTDEPFGRVVAPLGFTRKNLSVRMPAATTRSYLLEHRAVLSTAAGQPFSYVVERYSKSAVRPPKAYARSFGKREG